MSIENSTFNSLLDSNWDDIAELPEYTVWPVGMYKVLGKTAKIVPATADKEAKIQFGFELMEVMEIAEGQDDVEPPVPGSPLSQTYSGDKGISRLKTVYKDVIASMGIVTVRDFLDQFAGMEMGISNKQRVDQNDATKKYNNVSMALPV